MTFIHSSLIPAMTIALICSAAFADSVPYDGQTANGDYTISTANQLVLLANHVPSGGFSSSTFTLLNDVDMSGTSWTRPIGLEKAFAYYSNPAVPFKGKFDGGGHVIRNLNVNCSKDASCGSSYGWGLFGRVLDAEIRNLTVEGTIGGERCIEVGMLVGCVDANTVISNCSVRAEIPAALDPWDQRYNGALIGCVTGANCLIADCSAAGFVGGRSGGGLVGRVDAAPTFQRCHADTQVMVTNAAAAFVDIVLKGSRFEHCSAKGSVASSTGSSAGFVGTAQGSACFVDCAADGEVAAQICGGGFVFRSDLAVYTNCVAKGDVTVRSAVSSQGYSENAAGGFAGILNANGGEFVRCSAEGNVNSQGSGGYVGGFLGNGYNAGGTFRQCRASGNCEGQANVGGFFGNMSKASSCAECFALGEVVARAENVGGFVGYVANLTCQNSYCSGNVSGVTPLGGYVGRMASGTFTNCYAAGGYSATDVAGYGYHDGFVGRHDTGVITSCFALLNHLSAEGITVLTDAEFLNPINFSVWPTDIWWLPSSDGVSRPQLMWSYQNEGTIVPSAITGSRDLAIPNAWFASYPSFVSKFGSEKANAAVQSTGKKSAEGLSMSVWQDYVTGNDPTDSNSVFTVSIAVTNGVPYIGWSPDLNSNGTTRVYQILGKDSLTNEVWRVATATNHFFTVTVSMPIGTEVSDIPGQELE